MRRAGSTLLTFFMVNLLVACTAHNPFNITPVTDSTPTSPATVYAPNANRIRITTGDLPSGTAYTVIGKIDAGSNWYGPDTDAEKLMADRTPRHGR